MNDDETTLSVSDETLIVDKRLVKKGKVRVRTVTETEPALVEALLEIGSVEVTRVPVGRHVEEAPAVRVEGDLTIVPVLEEVLVVEKRLVLTEEIHIRRTRRQERVELPTTVRRQHAIVEREASSGPNHADAFPEEGSAPTSKE